MRKGGPTGPPFFVGLAHADRTRRLWIVCRFETIGCHSVSMTRLHEHRTGLSPLRATYERMADATVCRTEFGWRFFDIQGRSFVLTDAEGEALRAEAQQRLDALFGGMIGAQFFKIAWTILLELVALRLFDLFEMAGQVPRALYFCAGITVLFGDAIREAQFLFDAMRWREQHAQRLRRRDDREHEGRNYAWFFDPRLPRIVAGVILACALALAIEAFKPPVYAVVLIVVGLLLVGIAALPGRRGGTSSSVAPAPRRRDIRHL